MYNECPGCGYIPPCPSCGYQYEPEPTEEELETQREEDARWKHEKDESYREAYYKKKGWRFTPRPFEGNYYD